MYTGAKVPSHIVTNTRRVLSPRYEAFEAIKESGRKSLDPTSPEKNNVARAMFHTSRRVPHPVRMVENEVITPQHEEIVNFISDSWNSIVVGNPNDSPSSGAVASAGGGTPQRSRNVAQPPSAAIYCVEPPSPLLSDFKPFDLESWWGRRLFDTINKDM